ncbi:MAG: hypothetical protein ACUVWP_07475 [bacterium]
MRYIIFTLVIFFITPIIRAESWSRIELPFGECTVNDISTFIDPIPVWYDIWVATDKGIAFIHRKGIDYWTSEVGLSSAPILSVVPRPPLSSGVVYFGTDGDGVWTWGADETSKMKFIPESVVSKVHIIKDGPFGKPIFIIGYGTQKRPSDEIFLTIDYNGGTTGDHTVLTDFKGSPAEALDITEDKRGWPIVLIKWHPEDKKPYTEILLFYETEIIREIKGEKSGTWMVLYDRIGVSDKDIEPRCILNEDDKVLYIGTNRGVYTLSLSDKKMRLIENYPIKSGVNDLMKDSRGFIWACTDDGLYVYDGKYWWRMMEDAGLGLKSPRKCVENGLGDIYVIGDDSAVWELRLNIHKKSKEGAIDTFSEIAERF